MAATIANACALVGLANKSSLGSGFLNLSISARKLENTSPGNFIWISSVYPFIGSTRIPCSSHNTPPMYYKVRLRYRELRRQCSTTAVFYIEEKDHDVSIEEKDQDVSIDETDHDVSRATLIWRAIKLPIYSVALVPITVASAVAYYQTGLFSVRRFLILLSSSVLVILWLNLSNDVYDYDTGADKNKKESVVNLMGSRTGVLVAAFVFLFLGFAGLTWTAIDAMSLRSILLLASAIACGYVYQSPPFRLGYKGLGEPLCFAAFGPFATTAFYLLQSTNSELPITGTLLSASFLVGLTTTLILFCSHFHQVNGDRIVGKISPLVRLGTKVGSEVVKTAVLILYCSLFLLGVCRIIPLPCVILSAMTIPIGNLVVSYVRTNHEDESKIFMAKYYCVRLHALFGAALAAGLVASKCFNPVLP